VCAYIHACVPICFVGKFLMLTKYNDNWLRKLSKIYHLAKWHILLKCLQITDSIQFLPIICRLYQFCRLYQQNEFNANTDDVAIFEQICYQSVVCSLFIAVFQLSHLILWLKDRISCFLFVFTKKNSYINILY